jgi:hypothetical protein
LKGLSITFDDSGSLKPVLRIGRRDGFANNQFGAAIGKVIENSPLKPVSHTAILGSSSHPCRQALRLGI